MDGGYFSNNTAMFCCFRCLLKDLKIPEAHFANPQMTLSLFVIQLNISLF